MQFPRNEYILIKIEDWLFLLAQSGFSSIFGYVEEESKDRIPKEEIYESMIRLYQAGYVEWDQETIKILEPLSSMIQAVKAAPRCVQVDWYNHDEVRAVYYPGPELTLKITQESGKTDLKLSLIPSAELQVQMEESMEELEEVEYAYAYNKKEESTVLADYRVYETESGIAQGNIQILENDFHYFILVGQYGEEERYGYNRQVFFKELSKLMEA